MTSTAYEPAPPPPELAPQNWRRLNPRMLLVHPVQELMRGLPVLVVVVFAGHDAAAEIRGIVIAAVLVVLGLVRWFTTRYRVWDESLQIERGLARRRVVAVRLDRVRTVDVSAHPLHRLLGLGRVVVGTGRNDRKNRDSNLVLDALTMPEAEQLRRELLGGELLPVGARPQAVDADIGEDELLRLDNRWCWYGPFTLSGAVTALAVLGVAWNAFAQANVDPNSIGAVRSAAGRVDRAPLWLATGAIFVIVLVVVGVLSVLGYVLAFWNLRLTRRGDGTLHVRRGLLTTRSTAIEGSRLRGVEISQPLLLRWAGGARCIAIATGLRVGRGSERGGSLLVPPAPSRVTSGVAGRVLRTPVPVKAELTAHVPAAQRRRLVRALVPALVVAGAVCVPAALGAIDRWWLLTAALVPLGVLLGRDRYAALGHGIVADHLVTRFGSLVRRRCVVECEGIIGWTVRRSFFQRRAGVATLVATTAAGRQAYRLTDVTSAQLMAVIDAATPGLLDFATNSVRLETSDLT